MQSKPASAAAEVAMVVRDEIAPDPILDATSMAGNADAEDWTTSMTMSPPNSLLEPLTRRSGDTAPSKMKLDGLLMVPFWIRLWVAGLISYQRTWEPTPPRTACWVHRAAAPPRAGAMASPAWGLRASRVARGS